MGAPSRHTPEGIETKLFSGAASHVTLRAKQGDL